MAQNTSKKKVSLIDEAVLKEMNQALQKNKNIIPADKKRAQEAIEALKKGEIQEADFINKMVYADSISVLESAEKKGVQLDWKTVKHTSVMNANDVPVLVKKGYDPNQPQDVGGERPYSLVEYCIVRVDEWVKINDKQDAKAIALNKASIAIKNAAMPFILEQEKEMEELNKLIPQVYTYDSKKAPKKETEEQKLERGDRLLAEFRTYEGKENLTPSEKEKLALVQKIDGLLKHTAELGQTIMKKREELNDSDEKLGIAMTESSETFNNIMAGREICTILKQTGTLDKDNTQKADTLINFINDFELEKRMLYTGRTKEELLKKDAEDAKNAKKGKGNKNPKTAYLNRIENDKQMMANATQGIRPTQPRGVSSRLAGAADAMEEMPKEQYLAANQSGKSHILAQNGQQIHLADSDIQKTKTDQKNGSSLA